LANLAWHHQNLRYVHDAGDVTCPDGNLEAAQERLAEKVAQVLNAGDFPLVLGGGHETAFGTFLGIKQSDWGSSNIGIVNIDAHFDLRNATQGTSGTPFAQMADWCRRSDQPFRYFCIGISEPANTAALFERARSLGVQWRVDTELMPPLLDKTLADLQAFAESCDQIYISVDLDVLPAATMPAVSAPAAHGVPLHIVEALIAAVLRGNHAVAIDIVELNPTLDSDGRGAQVAARLIWTIARDWPMRAFGPSTTRKD
jgi:formiminoglutamase